ncbi:MAG: DegT/DnrJ/EryC1/StrS aminotransferase family protein [Rhodospirillales bacterium]|jgi:perosamine synthetase|nr:DegT/DnrJ/EryC1/StrS aminotransferase family protein [Rhodospirillales bacterium]
MAIPRAQIGLGYGELFRFIGQTISPTTESVAEDKITAFEKAFAQRYGDDYRGIVCCKARMAFYHLLKAMDLRPHSEIMISAIHVADFVNIIRLAGHTPVAIDLQVNGYDIDPNDLKAKLSERTGLILVTHLSGYPSDMPTICQIADAHGVPVVEDCSQALSATLGDKRIGTFGKAAIFSLSLLKSVCTLNGGMIVTRNEALHEKLATQIKPLPAPARLPLIQEAIKNLVLKTLLSRLVFSIGVFPLLKLAQGGYDRLSSYQKTNKTVILRDRLPDDFMTRFLAPQAILGLSQLDTLEERETQRIIAGRAVRASIKRAHETILPKTIAEDGSGYWLFPLLIDRTTALQRELANQGIDSSKLLLSVLSLEEAFSELGFSCPNAENLRRDTLFIPMYADLDGKDVERIARVVPELVKNINSQEG